MNMELVWKVVACSLAGIIGLVSVYVAKFPQDNPIEELSELVIKDQSGIDIDLTPLSKEPDANK